MSIKNSEKKLNKPLKPNASKTKKKKKSNASENNKRKPLIVKPISMPSEPKEQWRKPTEKTVKEKKEKLKNQYSFLNNLIYIS